MCPGPFHIRLRPEDASRRRRSRSDPPSRLVDTNRPTELCLSRVRSRARSPQSLAELHLRGLVADAPPHEAPAPRDVAGEADPRRLELLGGRRVAAERLVPGGRACEVAVGRRGRRRVRRPGPRHQTGGVGGGESGTRVCRRAASARHVWGKDRVGTKWAGGPQGSRRHRPGRDRIWTKVGAEVDAPKQT